MNFKEGCDAVLEETDGRAIQMASVALGRDSSGNLYLTNPTHRNIVRWFASEYKRVQLKSAAWAFHRKRGAFLTTVADKAEYIKSSVRELDDNSVYYTPSGKTTRNPLLPQSYTWWMEQQRTNVVSSVSIPTHLIEGPSDSWILWPPPSAIGTVYADWTIKPHSLIEADDEPCWDEHYHEILVWLTLRLYAAEFSGEGSASKLTTRVNMVLPGLLSAFERDYLPPTEGPVTFF